MRSTTRLALLGLVVLSPALPGMAGAQLPDTVKAGTKARSARLAPGEPCCSVVRIDKALATVTARETATGYTFSFKVKAKDRALLGSIKVGDKVWADFAKKTVKLKKNESEVCCSIVATPAPARIPAPGSSRSLRPES